MPTRHKIVKIGLDSYMLALKRNDTIEISEKPHGGGFRRLIINHSLAWEIVQKRDIEF
jgi:hypothetical protein